MHGENAEAERVFRAEIAKHPRNGRALFGLLESLKRQNKTTAAQMVEREFKEAWQTADVKLRVEDLSGMQLKDEKAAMNQTTLRFSDIKLKTGGGFVMPSKAMRTACPLLCFTATPIRRIHTAACCR